MYCKLRPSISNSLFFLSASWLHRFDLVLLFRECRELSLLSCALRYLNCISLLEIFLFLFFTSMYFTNIFIWVRHDSFYEVGLVLIFFWLFYQNERLINWLTVHSRVLHNGALTDSRDFWVDCSGYLLHKVIIIYTGFIIWGWFGEGLGYFLPNRSIAMRFSPISYLITTAGTIGTVPSHYSLKLGDTLEFYS